MALGRPTKYTPKMLKEAEAYLEECKPIEIEEPDEPVDEEQEPQPHGGSLTRRRRLVTYYRSKVPTIGGLARRLNVARSTLYLWANEHADFSDIMEALGAEQEDRLIQNGLYGTFNPTIAKVLLTKHGYREGHEHTGANGTDLFQPSKEEQDRVDKALDELDGAGKANTKKR